MNTSRLSVIGFAALLGIVLLAATEQSRADEPRSKPPRPQWEYKVEHCGYHSGLVDQLNQIGNDGWELLQIADGMGVFKRMKYVQDKISGSAVQVESLKELGVIVVRARRRM